MRAWKKLLLVLAGLLVVLGGIVGLKVFQIADLIAFATEMEEQGFPPVPVATVLAAAEEWEDTLSYTGSLRPVRGVTLTAELGGTISAIPVENGARVTAGDVLIELDTTQEQADLASAEARLRLARINLDRASGLLEKRIIAQSEYDEAAARYDEARAEVENLKAIIAKKIIRAPFDGRAGIRGVNLGQTVSPGDELIPLHDNDPIFVEFDVPQTRLGLVREGQKVRVLTDNAPEPIKGAIVAINPMVDELTRSARVQGLLENPGERLRAGQFAQVELILPERLNVVSIPQSAVVSAAYGDSVFVVREVDGRMTARQQFVDLGRRKGDFVAVLRGLTPGDRVVSAGAFKLNNDAAVEINDAMQPAASLSPTPDNS